MMEGFLNNLSKFNNSLWNLLFLTFSIKIVSLKSFLLPSAVVILYFQRFYNRNTFTLFPLNSCRWLARDVVNYAVDAIYLVYNAATYVF